MDKRKDTVVEALLEQLIEQGPNDVAGVFARAFDLRQRNPSSLLALATATSPAFQRRLTDAWSGADALSDDEVTSLSVAVLESGAAERLRAPCCDVSSSWTS